VSSHRSDENSFGERHRLRAWDLGSTGVRALAVVAVLVAVLAAVVAWRSRPELEPVTRPANEPTTSGPPSGPVATAGTIVVAVSGLVQKPGLVRLPAGSRVADAIAAAGGALPGTDLSMVNLARKVSDGELVVIGPAASVVPARDPGTGASGGQVNLNTATLAELQELPGVGPVLAERIIDYRDRNGGFRTVEDLRKVTGIGDARFNDLKARVTV
jgi:competence protein ComEA